MKLTICFSLFLLVLPPTATMAQTIPLTDKLTQLEGQWARDATRGTGWLAVTMRRDRAGSPVNLMQEVYIVLRNELTEWRVLNVELPDGSQGKIDCGNRHAIVYVHK
jgi:hypothetical protein